jgi:hypothetical protein
LASAARDRREEGVGQQAERDVPVPLLVLVEPYLCVGLVEPASIVQRMTAMRASSVGLAIVRRISQVPPGLSGVR